MEGERGDRNEPMVGMVVTISPSLSLMATIKRTTAKMISSGSLLLLLDEEEEEAQGRMCPHLYLEGSSAVTKGTRSAF